MSEKGIIKRDPAFYFSCPLCGEDDFDNVGFVYHVKSGHCEIFNEAEEILNKEQTNDDQ